jgi:hypothetical protein
MLNDRDLDRLAQMIDKKASKIGKEQEIRAERKELYEGIKKFEDNEVGLERLFKNASSKMHSGELKAKLEQQVMNPQDEILKS